MVVRDVPPLAHLSLLSIPRSCIPIHDPKKALFVVYPLFLYIFPKCVSPQIRCAEHDCVWIMSVRRKRISLIECNCPFLFPPSTGIQSCLWEEGKRSMPCALEPFPRTQVSFPAGERFPRSYVNGVFVTFDCALGVFLGMVRLGTSSHSVSPSLLCHPSRFKR